MKEIERIGYPQLTEARHEGRTPVWKKNRDTLIFGLLSDGLSSWGKKKPGIRGSRCREEGGENEYFLYYK